MPESADDKIPLCASFFGCGNPPCINHMQGRRSRPKNDLNGRASYLCFRAKVTHGREAEPENDKQPDLRKKLTPGSGQALKWG
ncbi:hypothetical protein NDU88_005021 [Pleurodeles waltl]|uniref:Uncharacterized protein n=1 Tax=Pleurodeles waltl TaxID=8319 RepID=A0AAV7MFN9_PLEWA|nr:hypothetical protein NDU88_005021 [Pleurodeles waltl]